MKTTRPDYEDVQAMLAGLGDDEPLLVIRGRDPAFQAAAQAWINRSHALGAEAAIMDRMADLKRSADDWQRVNGTKVADLPDELLTAEEKQERYRLSRQSHREDIGADGHIGRSVGEFHPR